MRHSNIASKSKSVEKNVVYENHPVCYYHDGMLMTEIASRDDLIRVCVSLSIPFQGATELFTKTHKLFVLSTLDAPSIPVALTAFNKQTGRCDEKRHCLNHPVTNTEILQFIGMIEPQEYMRSLARRYAVLPL